MFCCNASFYLSILHTCNERNEEQNNDIKADVIIPKKSCQKYIHISLVCSFTALVHADYTKLTHRARYYGEFMEMSKMQTEVDFLQQQGPVAGAAAQRDDMTTKFSHLSFFCVCVLSLIHI